MYRTYLLRGGHILGEEEILGAPINCIVVEKGGILWEGGADSRGSHVVVENGDIFLEGGVDSRRVAYSC